MQPAARVSDPHTCPMVDPGPKPHVGGPILPPGCVTVLIGAKAQGKCLIDAAASGAPFVESID